uniref:Uncharacterized protein n=1 Tax=Anopheles darlingi TaxID=43151 RepID=A0A2M4D6D4_ANODA
MLLLMLFLLLLLFLLLFLFVLRKRERGREREREIVFVFVFAAGVFFVDEHIHLISDIAYFLFPSSVYVYALRLLYALFSLYNYDYYCYN